jgi:hypothetical protein
VAHRRHEALPREQGDRALFWASVTRAVGTEVHQTSEGTAEAPLRFMHEPPGYQLHVWREDTGLVTHTAVFGEWPDPHPLRAAS